MSAHQNHLSFATAASSGASFAVTAILALFKRDLLDAGGMGPAKGRPKLTFSGSISAAASPGSFGSQVIIGIYQYQVIAKARVNRAVTINSEIIIRSDTFIARSNCSTTIALSRIPSD